MSYPDDDSTPIDAVGQSLAPQLGTDAQDLWKGRTDMRRLTVIPRELMMPLMYVEIRAKKSETWRTIGDVLRNYSVSIGGRGRRDIIRMEQVSRGGSANVEAEIEAAKPESWVQRNLTNRDWKEKAARGMNEV